MTGSLRLPDGVKINYNLFIFIIFGICLQDGRSLGSSTQQYLINSIRTLSLKNNTTSFVAVVLQEKCR